MHNSLYVTYHFMSTCIVTMNTAFRCHYWLLHTVQFTFVAAHRPVCYFLPHAVQSAVTCHTVAICWRVPCSLLLLPHAMQLLLVAYRAVCFCCHMLHSLLFVATCRTVAIGAAYHAVCRTLYSLKFVATCRAVCYLLSLSVAACRTVAICCHYLLSCRHLLPNAIQLLSIAACHTVAICCY